MKISIVTPVANESDTIDIFLDKIENVRNRSNHEIVSYFIFDKMSKDDTRSKIESRGSSKNICVYHDNSSGLVSCYVRGYEVAIRDNSDFIIEMDAGLSHDPDLVPRFIEAFESGFDACLGSRFSRGGLYKADFHRRFVSFFGGKLVNLTMGSSFEDPTSGFEGFKVKTALSHIDFSSIHAVGGMFQPEIKVRAIRFNPKTITYKEIPINYVQSTSSFKIKWVMLGLRSLWKIFLELRIGKANYRRDRTSG